jgi:hypothetical protein
MFRRGKPVYWAFIGSQDGFPTCLLLGIPRELKVRTPLSHCDNHSRADLGKKSLDQAKMVGMHEGDIGAHGFRLSYMSTPL